MPTPFKVGDHVSWSSQAGQASGKILKVHTQPVEFSGQTYPASPEAPQYEIQADRSDHIALHQGAALTRL
ncbi:MAG: DUF2945 domain-containing protein [Simplicispira sp.]|nr:DUF2945 domain-containing protein [Simplicispira sp.]